VSAGRTNHLSLRRAAEADAGALAIVGAATFLETFAGIVDGADIVWHCEREHSAARYLGWLRSPKTSVWLAETPHPPALVGYLVGHLVEDGVDLPLADLGPGDYEIKRIYILSRFQGGGVGRSLVERAIADALSLGATRMLLGVYSRNERAIGFYERLGFVTCGTRKFRVGAHDYDDRIMARKLP
jgi:ribosomal protein S18 acetylase RimI-like enzyme